MNKPIKFELAKLLKEKEYNFPCQYFYDGYGDYVHAVDFRNHNDSSVNVSTAPNTIDVIMWLYEKHGIWISCVILEDAPQFLSKIFIMNDLRESKNVGSFSSLLEAYETAIEYTLNNLI